MSWSIRATGAVLTHDPRHTYERATRPRAGPVARPVCSDTVQSDVTVKGRQSWARNRRPSGPTRPIVLALRERHQTADSARNEDAQKPMRFRTVKRTCVGGEHARGGE